MPAGHKWYLTHAINSIKLLHGQPHQPSAHLSALSLSRGDGWGYWGGGWNVFFPYRLFSLSVSVTLVPRSSSFWPLWGAKSPVEASGCQDKQVGLVHLFSRLKYRGITPSLQLYLFAFLWWCELFQTFLCFFSENIGCSALPLHAHLSIIHLYTLGFSRGYQFFSQRNKGQLRANMMASNSSS